MIRAGRYGYRAGVFTAEIPLVRRAPRPFRGAAVLYLEGFPTKIGGRIELALRSCRFGRIPLPATWVGECAGRSLSGLAEKEEMLRFDRAVKSFEAESNGDVIVVYRPPELLRLLIGGLR